MSSVTLWLNRNIASAYNALETIRSALQPGENWRIVTSHPYRYNAVFRQSDAHEIEPSNLDERRYVRWCLDFVQRHKVNVFLPGTKLRPIVKARQSFEALGVRLLAAADAETLHILESKSRLYRAISAELAPVPEYRVVHDLGGFDAAYAELRQRHRLVCFKPCVSVYGLGFHIVTDWGGGVRRLLNTASLRIGLRGVRRILGSQARFRPLMLMPYLPGPERSVDCLGRDGELLRCVVRRKASVEGYQKLEDNPKLVEVVRRLTAHFRLNGLFNVQFRDSGGVSYLLEINPRMSGGLYCSCLSGVAFPYWAVRLAVGSAGADQIPQPRVGFRVAQVNRAVRV
jgi:hypothetical protein